jgi:hypothetical protein
MTFIEILVRERFYMYVQKRVRSGTNSRAECNVTSSQTPSGKQATLFVEFSKNKARATNPSVHYRILFGNDTGVSFQDPGSKHITETHIFYPVLNTLVEICRFLTCKVLAPILFKNTTLVFRVPTIYMPDERYF